MTTISDFLKNDHLHCDQLLRQTESSVNHGLWPEANAHFELFQHALERHITMEETIIFPALEHAFQNAAVPTSVMRREHVTIRVIRQRLHNALVRRNHVAFFDHADTLQLTLHQHNEKEENILYSIVDRLIGRKTGDILSAMASFGTLSGMTQPLQKVNNADGILVKTE